MFKSKEYISIRPSILAVLIVSLVVMMGSASFYISFATEKLT